MAAYFQSLWIERTHQADGDDLISMMIHSEAMHQMSPQEFMGNLELLIVGGNDTTRNTMSGIIHALDKFPDQRKLFEENPDLIPNAVQERSEGRRVGKECVGTCRSRGYSSH